MSDICPKCGLPKELCVCETIAKEEEKIKVYIIKKRYGKLVTVIEGVSKDVNTKDVLRELKTKLACGGTFKNNTIELQGAHRDRAKGILVKLGFSSEKIDVA